jgi:succinylglutamic semialdehyde dehydrogenase
MSSPDRPEILRSTDPVTGDLVWEGPVATAADVDAAVSRARAALSAWQVRSFAERANCLRTFAESVGAAAEDLALAISRENGKPLWESRTEAAAVRGKIELSIEAHERRCADFVNRGAHTRFRPHGVVGVLGPFNFPAHLPNGHIAPALLAGNTVVFKPSQETPGVGEWLVRQWRASGLPSGALECVQGGAETGAHLAAHPGIDGLFFTGSAHVGKRLLAANADHPGKILALEMGGNNALVVHEVEDVRAAAAVVAQSAFISAGQRCTCARRLILVEGTESEQLLEALAGIARELRVGHFAEDPAPFLGPVISNAAADRILGAAGDLVKAGARAVLPVERLRAGAPLLRPGIFDVTGIKDRTDAEIFGPVLQVVRCRSFAEALEEAKRTRFGLAAGLLSASEAHYRKFRETVRAGIINWNHPLTGASSAAPFGGIGDSGNHRPSAYFAADYCSYPVASLERPDLGEPAVLPGFPGVR